MFKFFKLNPIQQAEQNLTESRLRYLEAIKQAYYYRAIANCEADLSKHWEAQIKLWKDKEAGVSDNGNL